MAPNSNNAQRKEKGEQEAFLSFAARIGERDLWTVVESRRPPEPDLLCHHAVRGPIAFELVSLVDEDVAVALTGRRGPMQVFSTADPTTRIIRAKLGRHYETEHAIELLVSWVPCLITPDDAILASMMPLLDAQRHPFRRVWYAGERECRCVWAL